MPNAQLLPRPMPEPIQLVKIIVGDILTSMIFDARPDPPARLNPSPVDS